MLSMTRKLLRFGKSLDFLQGALKSIHIKDTVLRLTLTLSKINQAFYLLFDHILWFNSVGAIKVDREYWGKISARFYLATLLLNSIRDLYGIYCVIQEELTVRKKLSSSRYKNGDTNYQSLNRRPATMLEITQQNIPLVLDTVKNFFDLPIPLCTLKYMQLSATKQGIFGLISSVVAVATVWNPNLKIVPS
ncbi:peroxisomal membrane protein 11B-like [Ruditapes philippinarum]|nr:peroxisomal membrane protein 11B-like [Ruditapes philippinarum]